MAGARLTGRGYCPPLHFVVYGCAVVSAWGVYRLTKWENLPSTTLINLGLLYEVLVAFCVVLIERTTPLSHGKLAGLSWVTVLIVFFPVVVPATPLKTLGAGSAVIVAALSAGWLITGSLDEFLMWNNAVAVALSIIPSLVVSRLGDQLGKARELGQYVLEEKLGQGNMGEVWRASHRGLSRPAAIKLIRSDFRGDGDEHWTRFRKEAWATAQLTSPHTVTVHDFGESEDGRFYFAMELLNGQDLKLTVEKQGPMAPDKAVAALMQVCRSLEEAHERGLVHRDIKPSNLFLCQVGLVRDFVKVLDFGQVIAGASSNTTGPSQVHQDSVFGTPEYMAPEQARGEAIDGRADLYALAGVGYWLLTGEPVFPHRSAADTFRGHLSEDPPPLSPRITGSRISSRLEAVLASCLQKDPQHRPADAGELWRQLSQCPEATWRRSHP